MSKKFYELIRKEYGTMFEVEGIRYVVTDKVAEFKSKLKICPDFLISKSIISFEILNELFDIKDFDVFYVDGMQYHLTGANAVDIFGRLISIEWLINRAEKGGVSYE